MKKGDYKFVLNRQKFIIAKVKVYDVTDTHVRIQNIINNDVCPPILQIPNDKVEETLYGNYQMAKIELGVYLHHRHKNTTTDDVISIGNYNTLMDIQAIKDYIDFAEKYAPEKLI